MANYAYTSGYGTFTGANGVQYDVYIKRTSVSVKKTLTLSSNPIVTEYDNSQDIMTPIRSQTGYLNVVESNENASYQSIMPSSATSHLVELKSGDTLVWRGFMRQENFKGNFVNGFMTVGYPLSSPISVLKNYNMSISSGTDMISIAGILKEALDKTNVSWGDVYLPAEFRMSDNGYIAPLYIQVSRASFFERKVDANGRVIYIGKSYYDLLSDILTILGWTAVEYGEDLYLVNKKTTSTYIKIKYSDLESIIAGNTVSTTSVTAGTLSISKIKTSDPGYEYILGSKSVKIESSTGSTDDILIAVQEGDVRYESNIVRTIGSKTLYAIGYYPTQDCEVEFYSYDNMKSSYDEEDEWDVQSQGDCDGTSAIDLRYTIASGYAKADLYNTADATSGDKTDYTFNSGIVIAYNWQSWYNEHLERYSNNSPADMYTSRDMPIFKCRTKSSIFLKDGCLYIDSGKTAISGVWKLTASIRFGKKYWNGSSWQTSATPLLFAIDVETNGIKNYKTLSMNYVGAKGYIIPISSAMTGTIELKLYPPYGSKTSLIEPERCILTDLSVGYAQAPTIEQDAPDGKNVYYTETGAATSEESSITIPFATRVGTQTGYTLLVYNNDYLGRFSDSSGTLEDRLLSTMKALYGKRRIEYTVEVETMDIKPFNFIQYNYKNKLISVSTDWYSSTQTIKMQTL